MDWSADHAGFVIASYAISIVFLAGLIIYTLRRDRNEKNPLAQFEKTKK